MVPSRTLAALAVLVFAAAAPGQGEPDVISAIIDEGKNNSQVWDTLLYISEEIGPRLTGSSNANRANVWARDRFSELGLDAWLFKWGDIPVGFDRGPSHVKMVEPEEREFEFTARAWSAGTDGPVRGAVVKEPRSMEDLDAIRDRLEGAWILTKGRPRGRRGVVPEGEAPELREEIAAALESAGIAGRIVSSRSDLVTTGGQRGWREMTYDSLPTGISVSVRRSDYDAINSRLADGEAVTVEVDLKHHFNPGPIPVYDTVAEIRGTEKPDEVVIVSAHLDSWDGPGSMGTQDNGTGSAVTIEAARILAAVGAKPKRTIRFILWMGEEQGLLGSRGYVESLSEEELAKVSAVFVDDGGTNYQGGLACVENMEEMLVTATAPVSEAFPDLPFEISVRERMPRGGGSDHASFNRVGVPGFFWAEEGSGGREGKTYRHIWHTQHDTPRYAVPEYLVQSATCSAVTAYNIAMADDLLPRYVPEEVVSADQPLEPWNLVEGPISGTWIGKPSEEGAREMTFTIVFEMNDEGKARGTFASRMGEGRLRGVTFDAATGALSFKYAADWGEMSFTGEVKGEEMTGTFGSDNFSFPIKAVRQQPEAEGGDVAVAEEKQEGNGAKENQEGDSGS